jgi:hypothetical protein
MDITVIGPIFNCSGWMQYFDEFLSQHVGERSTSDAAADF